VAGCRVSAPVLVALTGALQQRDAVRRHPDNIVVIDNVAPNPLHASTGVPTAFATHVRGVSALAFWKLSDGRGFVEDVCGIVEWRTSDASIARVDDTFSDWPETSRAMAATGPIVSPWFAKL
jgi:hypothetical protein